MPRETRSLEQETADNLVERLCQAMHLLVKKGICFDDLLAASLVSPSCGLGTMTVEDAERALALCAGVSRGMRKRYLLS